MRGFPSYRASGIFPGLWSSAMTGTHVGYESWLERDWLTVLDASPEVVEISSRSFRLSWPVEG
ncbi:hypothetical protein ABIA39_005368 [Nocardia sp. GAS34]